MKEQVISCIRQLYVFIFLFLRWRFLREGRNTCKKIFSSWRIEISACIGTDIVDIQNIVMQYITVVFTYGALILTVVSAASISGDKALSIGLFRSVLILLKTISLFSP